MLSAIPSTAAISKLLVDRKKVSSYFRPMQYRLPLLVALAVLPASLLAQTAIHRCTIDGRLVIQETPCPAMAPRVEPQVMMRKAPVPTPQEKPDADAIRRRHAERMEEIQRGFRDPNAPPKAAAAAPSPRATQALANNLVPGTNSNRAALVDRMTTYTTFLGRGVACGAPGVESASQRFGAWMDREGLTREYLAVAAEGIKYSAQQQQAGRSPDSCSTVLRVFPTIAWP
jgi:hypothetical protein